MARGSSTLAVVGSPEPETDAGSTPIPRPSPAPPPHAASAAPDRPRRAPGGDPDEPVDAAARTSLHPTAPARPAGEAGVPRPVPPAVDRAAPAARPEVSRTVAEPQTRTMAVRPSPHPRTRADDVRAGRPVGDAGDPRTTALAESALAETALTEAALTDTTLTDTALAGTGLAETGPPTAPRTAVTAVTARPAEHGGARPVQAEGRAAPSTAAVDVAEAEEFLRLFHEENPASGSLAARLAAVRDEIAETGTYVHTTAELEYGARVAWRNSARCIGRLYWRSLHLRDRRHIVDPEGVSDECVAHLRDATRRGRIRSTITVFAPDTPSAPGPRIWNEQLVRYAGYRAGGAVLGDPRYVGFTDTARSLGWVPPSPMGGFDVLPLVVSGGGRYAAEGPHLAEVPADAVLEVPLSHPDHEWFAELGLQWHAVPAISNMRLDVGGVSYPAAPFNGWYMATEIGARNLADPERYDLLGEIAEAMGLDTSSERTMWRDRAAIELTLAVQHSYDTAGVTLADHHGESQRFLRHVEREEAAGRSCPVDWSWIVPPISGGLTPVFHRYYDEPTDTGPMFRIDDTAKARGRGCPI